MRLFIALNFNSEMKNELICQIDTLRDNSYRGNYTRAENLHLTLAFIGEYSNVGNVIKAMDGVNAEEFSLTLSGSGKFGSLYWIGIKKEPTLDVLVKSLRGSLANSEIPFDRKPFSPHITIGREIVSDSYIRLVPRAVKMRVNTVSLMKSERINGKLTYTRVYEKRLAPPSE